MNADILLDELTQDSASARHPQRGVQMSFDELIAPVGEETIEPPLVEHRPARRARPAVEAPPVSGRHQDVRLYLTVLLKTYVEATDAGLVRDAPYRVQKADGQFIEPDIVFVSHLNFDRVHDAYVEGPPDIVVEVASPETTARDRGDRFVLYEALGVREYWLIDPVRELVNFYHLGPDGQYGEFRPDMAGRMRSRVLKGFVLDVDLLWNRVLPTTAEVVEMVQGMMSTRS